MCRGINYGFISHSEFFAGDSVCYHQTSTPYSQPTSISHFCRDIGPAIERPFCPYEANNPGPWRKPGSPCTLRRVEQLFGAGLRRVELIFFIIGAGTIQNRRSRSRIDWRPDGNAQPSSSSMAHSYFDLHEPCSWTQWHLSSPKTRSGARG